MNLRLRSVGLAAVVAMGLCLKAGPAAALSAMAMKAICGESAKATGSADDAVRRGDAAFAERAAQGKALEAAVAFQEALALDPNQADVQLKASRAWYLLGDGYYRAADDQDAMVEAFEKGMGHAGAALALVNPAFKRKVCTGAAVTEVVATLDKASVPAMYWFATHLGKYGLAKDLLEVLANKDMIFEAMVALKRIQPDYFYFAPDRYLGGYFTKVPFPKGDMGLSFEHLRQSMRGAPQYFATYVLAAEMYAVKAAQTVDPRSLRCHPGAEAAPADAPAPSHHPCRSLFERLLRHVIEAPPSVLPELEAEQRLEQLKAQRLLEDIDVYFPPLT